MTDIHIQDKTIFIVDDDQSVLDFVQMVLNRFGSIPITFINGEQMLDKMEVLLPDLIILDLDIPSGMNGFDICRTLKTDERYKEIPIIFLSGSSDIHNKVKGFEVGAVDYIPKPVLPRELTARVKTHLISAQLKIALKKSEAKYRAMMESMVDPVYIVSPDRTIEYMNPAMIAYIEKDGVKKNGIGKPCHMIFNDSKNICKWCCFDLVKKGQVVENEYINPKSNRRYRENSMPIYQENGSVSKMTILRDITDYWNTLEEKKKAERQLMQAQKMESIGQLAAGIAHEINTPIQFVQDNSDFLKTAFSEILPALSLAQKLLDQAKSGTIEPDIIEKLEMAFEEADIEYYNEEVPSAIEQALDGADRVSTIVRSMKEFSNPGGKEIHTDINQALNNTITISSNEWKYVSDVTCDFDNTLPQVFCNPGEINQVLLNIIINAANAIEEAVGSEPETKGQIHIQTQKAEDRVQIIIKDNGAGISKQDLPKIFDPFFTTKEIGQGSGQGLSIAYAIIVEKHNGKIECQSEPGKGSIFTISLPIEKQ